MVGKAGVGKKASAAAGGDAGTVGIVAGRYGGVLLLPGLCSMCVFSSVSWWWTQNQWRSSMSCISNQVATRPVDASGGDDNRKKTGRDGRKKGGRAKRDRMNRRKGGRQEREPENKGRDDDETRFRLTDAKLSTEKENTAVSFLGSWRRTETQKRQTGSTLTSAGCAGQWKAPTVMYARAVQLGSRAGFGTDQL